MSCSTFSKLHYIRPLQNEVLLPKVFWFFSSEKNTPVSPVSVFLIKCKLWTVTLDKRGEWEYNHR